MTMMTMTMMMMMLVADDDDDDDNGNGDMRIYNSASVAIISLLVAATSG